MKYAPPTDSPSTAPERPLWRNQDFLLLWSGQIVSTIGTNMSALALPLLVLALTHSPAQAGLVAALQMLPYLLFSLPVGALIDRWDRKAIMIRCDAVRWLALGSVPLAFFLGHLSVAQLYIIAVIEGTANVLFGLAQISALPRVVKPAQIPQAYALDQVTEYISTLLGPNLSTLLISLARSTVLGAILAYLVDSISYLISVISLRFIRVPFQNERKQEKIHLWQDIMEGLRFLWQQPILRIMVLLTMSVNFLSVPVKLAIIVLVQNRLHLDALMLGIIISADGIGGLVGGFLAPWVKRHLRFGQIIIGSVIVWSLATLLCTLATSAPLLIIGRGLVGLIWPLYAVALVSYRLSITPDELQGRVNSSFRVLTYGIEAIGSALGGLLLAMLDPRIELGLISGGLALSAIIVVFTHLRRA
ncbi:MFS transporter [Ktedonosporobacter rubrisoli]|nr:MFS transporter [Ktedonosporobacter rubrisoli]